MMTLAGCGSGTVHIVPMMRSDFPEQEKLVFTVPVREAYYDVAADGKVQIGLRYRVDSPLGPGLSVDWQMGLTVEGMPAGRERLCRLTAGAARIVQVAGADQRRSQAWSGIAVLHEPVGGRLRGRFHLTMRQQQFALLTGWSPSMFRAPVMIVVGEFEAVKEAAATKAIYDRLDAVGFDESSGGLSAPIPLQLPMMPATKPSP